MEKRKGRGIIPRTAILAALWTLIAVTLLSALAPLGPPLSRVTGSAFNPATSDVVLKARTPATTQMVQPARPDGDGLPLLPLHGLCAALLAMVWRILTAIFAPARPQGRTSFALVRAGHARAPPAAS
ncbi:hypothetical protein Q4610_06655 [Sphingobium sp. HBC34]|uniref:Uncharacterized protein n=1 Tax=Sphingobium cyanobacteriorum TaxID=3063954 RepID=A0ABT8ZK57_9SPHN|nr:hypothetical protein [Sphingobium sp. HBC34]MDO7834723.1 hypothetical protein [Sphingobium sp. HBC34]